MKICSCESWILTAELQSRIQAMEMRYYHKILHISYKDHVTSKEVRAKIQQAVGPHRPDGRKETQAAVVWSCLPFIRSGQTILQGTVKGGRRQSRQRKRWEDNIRDGQAWSSASPRGQWRTGKMEKTGCKIICGAPTTLAVKGVMMMMMMMMMSFI